jgi:Tol biopolymer transport system component
MTIWVMNANGSGERQLGMSFDGYPSFSPNGTRIVFIRTDPIGAGYGIWVAATDGSSFVQLTRDSWGMDLEHPSFSPNGRLIVFDRHSNATGPSEIFVIGARGKGRRQLTHLSGGAAQPSWGR